MIDLRLVVFLLKTLGTLFRGFFLFIVRVRGICYVQEKEDYDRFHAWRKSACL